MSKKMIFSFIVGLAFAVVLVSGNYFSAKAECGLCNISLPSPCLTCAPQTRDPGLADRLTFDRTSHGAGSVGYGRGNINDFSHQF
jgi:hypothetical protein